MFGCVFQCCVCGGGPSPEPAADSDIVLQDAVEASQFQSCWDLPSWYDSTGDGCVWYEEENNCEYYGNQFPSDIDGQTANEAVSRNLMLTLSSSTAFYLIHASTAIVI